jgi:hypothetical protein
VFTLGSFFRIMKNAVLAVIKRFSRSAKTAVGSPEPCL